MEESEYLFHQLNKLENNSDSKKISIAVTVILPIQLQGYYSYAVPDNFHNLVAVGKRVLAPFGLKKVYAGLIIKKDDNDKITEPKATKLRPIIDVLDNEPITTPAQLELIKWISEYYMCTPGEVYNATFPAGFKLSSESYVELVSNDFLLANNFNDLELKFIHALSDKGYMRLNEVKRYLNCDKPREKLIKLEQLGIITYTSYIKEKQKTKTTIGVHLSPEYRNDDMVNNILKDLKPGSVKEKVLQEVLDRTSNNELVLLSHLTKKFGNVAHVINAFTKSKILHKIAVPIDRIQTKSESKGEKEIYHTSELAQAVAEIQNLINYTPQKPIVVQGVKGSEKTNIFIPIMKEIIANGKQALYLLPGISITKQNAEQIVDEFGKDIGIYHKKCSDVIKVDIWQKLIAGNYKAIIGDRSAVFLPFKNLGIIIIDEEYDSSYKQHEPAPRYNTRDAAIWLSAHLNIPVILGSTTTGIESFYKAINQKFHLVEILKTAIDNNKLDISIVNMRDEVKNRTSYAEFSSFLIQEINISLTKKEQIIIFKDKRGYAPYLVCTHCGNVPHCIQCDISLTLHKLDNYLQCHYCGYINYTINKCSVCNSESLLMRGLGTERLEEDISTLFPNARIERMDQDSMRGKNSYAILRDKFNNREIDILVGTQMLTKGLVYENVTLVAVVDADRLLYWPNYRAYESAYQLLTQFADVAESYSKLGRLIIQTYNPTHPVLQHLSLPYRRFYEFELNARKSANYPPFCRLIQIEAKHKSRDYLETETHRFAILLREKFGKCLIGPEYPQVARIRNLYRMQMMVKIIDGHSHKKVKSTITDCIETYFKIAPNKTLQIYLNVDPI